MDVQIPFLNEIFIGVSLVLGILFFLRANARWQAVLSAVRHKKGFSISSLGYKKAVVNEGVAVLIYFSASVLFLFFSPVGFWIGFIAVVWGLEGIFHILHHAASSSYKVLVQDNMITVISNSVRRVRWSQITKVERANRDVMFSTKDGQPFRIDSEFIKKDEFDSFLATLKEKADEKGLYFSADFES